MCNIVTDCCYDNDGLVFAEGGKTEKHILFIFGGGSGGVCVCVFIF